MAPRRTKHHGPVHPGFAVRIRAVGRADLGEHRVHEVGAMPRAGEPALHGLVGRALAAGDVFTDLTAVITSRSGAVPGDIAVGVLMGEVTAAGHGAAVTLRGGFQCGIPAQRSRQECSACRLLIADRRAQNMPRISLLTALTSPFIEYYSMAHRRSPVENRVF